MRKLGVLALAAFCLVPMVAGAQQSNEGATVTAPFMAIPPVIDGVMSPGEWDNAGVAPGTWTAHDSTTVAANKTEVRVCYGIDGFYILYICTDSQPVAVGTNSEIHGTMNGFAFGAANDYIATYLDPLYCKDAGFTYSIQAQPSKTSLDWLDDVTESSFNYTELGQWGGRRMIYNPPVEINGVLQYAGGGGGWDLMDSKIVDGPVTGGWCSEWKIAYSDLVPMAMHNMGDAAQIEGPLYELYLNGDTADPLKNQYLTLRTHVVAEDGTYQNYVGWGGGNGMPAPGTKWWMNFCRCENTSGQYTNWVGDSGGFVSAPYGDVVFGPASGSDVANATLHMQ